MSKRFELMFLLRKRAEYGGGKGMYKENPENSIRGTLAAYLTTSNDGCCAAPYAEQQQSPSQTQRLARRKGLLAVLQASEGLPDIFFLCEPRRRKEPCRRRAGEEREGRKGELKRRDAIRQGHRKRSKVAPPIPKKRAMSPTPLSGRITQRSRA